MVTTRRVTVATKRPTTKTPNRHMVMGDSRVEFIGEVFVVCVLAVAAHYVPVEAFMAAVLVVLVAMNLRALREIEEVADDVDPENDTDD